MATAPETSHDAAAGEEIANATVCGPDSPKHVPQRKQRNAFTDLMSPKAPKRKRTPPSSAPASDPARRTTFLGRDGLGAYIAAPESFPPSRVIYHTPQFVIINDLFPKSSIHLLLLPRDPTKQKQHPFEAFEDAPFLADVREEVQKVKLLAAKELRRRLGRYSVREQAHEAAVDAEAPASETPEARDWASEIVAGVHAVPSMNHLHVHVLSRDRQSECLKHRKHYNSFATGFMVPMEDFPLEAGDRRRHPGREGFLDEGMRCWRCGKDFGNRFARLKEHLADEFDVWKRE